MMPGTMAFRINPRVAWQVIAGEAVLIDLDHGHVLGLNESGSFLWPRLAEGTEDQLAADLARHFEIDEAAAQTDVRRFVDDLRARGYVLD